MTKRAPCRRCGNVICSCLVDTLAGQMKQAGLPTPEREVLFAPGRRWKFDFAYSHAKIAVELEGGIWSNGSHVRGARYRSDCEKYSTAAILGWCVLRFEESWVYSGKALGMIEIALRSRGVAVGSSRNADALNVRYPAR